MTSLSDPSQLVTLSCGQLPSSLEAPAASITEKTSKGPDMTLQLVGNSTESMYIVKRKLADRLASLYDEKTKGYSTPIWKNTAKKSQPTHVIDISLENEASGNNYTRGKENKDTAVEISVSEIKDKTDVGGSKENKVKIPIRSEWIGTSQFSIDRAISIQENGQLEALIDYRKAIVHDISLIPYHPSLYLDLSRVDSKLGFCDIGAANAYRALILIQAGLQLKDSSYPKILGRKVRHSIAGRMGTYSTLVIRDELKGLHLQAYRELLNGMLGAACFWDGLLEAKRALQLSPNDPEILELRQHLKDGFEDRHNGLKKLGVKDLVAITRTGQIYQKLYPWLDEKLYKRTPELVRQVNEDFGVGNCEVKSVFFGPPEIQDKEDVGPLGVFATRDIEEGEMVMVDQCLTGISDVPSSKLAHCDACHASLSIPFIHPADIIKPSCCGKVAFCSRECYESASKGYHRIICGKDIDWLYRGNTDEKEGRGIRWRPIQFLRLMSIVISDLRAQRTPTHPLQHPLIARMAANYAPASKHHPDTCCDWQYFENVVAPHRILQLLDVDMFTSPEFSPEVIQTIYWRMENNASMSTVNLSLSKPDPTLLDAEKDAVHMICLNPNYLFFNHSCEPNVSWHGAIPDPWVGIEWLRGLDGEIMRPGCSAVWCSAARDIRKGEELKISYVGNPRGDVRGDRESKRSWLAKWFEGGCGCDICKGENEKAKVEGGKM